MMKRLAVPILIPLAIVVMGIVVSCQSPHHAPAPVVSNPTSAAYDMIHDPGAAKAESARAVTGAAPTADPRLAAPPGSLPALDEEVWVVVRPEKSAMPHAAADDIPGAGAGAIVGIWPGSDRQVPVPLKHTEVSARITGHIASVDVTQQFHNPFDSRIEAVYIFPLPDNAAVNEFIMTIGDRRIRGIIRDRAEAEQIYQQARDAGHNASLLTQERPNVFTQKVANIEPGRQIDVHIRYFHTLAYDDGWYEWVFPMVVGPRFNPRSSADGIGAVPLYQHGSSGQPTEVHYLRPGQRSGQDIGLKVALDAGVPIQKLLCTSHDVVVNEQAEAAEISLATHDTIPNRDFVLRWKVAGDEPRATLATATDSRGETFFSLMLYPPAGMSDLPRQPLELVFVIDCSGSMNGEPIRQARDAVHAALHRLEPRDTFQIINFSNDAGSLGSRPLPATADNLRRGHQYLDALHSEGGTMMITGIKAALDFPHDPERLRFVVFLTDGFIGNEREILAAIHQRLGASRIFSFGVGSAPNRYLMDRMAKMGRGAVAYLPLEADGSAVMDTFFARISHPVMTDLAIDWGGMQVNEVFPSQLPDLFVGRSVIVTGKLAGRAPTEANVRITGRAAGNSVQVALNPRITPQHSSALAAVWARQQIAQMYDRAVWDHDAGLAGRIRDVALRHELLSAYTAFIAVDGSRRTEGSTGTTVPVGVPVPKGVQYETTVQKD